MRRSQDLEAARWDRALINLLPLWLMATAMMAEGFPRPIPVPVGVAAFVAAIALAILLSIQRWMPVDLALYSLSLPLLLGSTYDEITTTYKTIFIVASTLIFSLGALAFQLSSKGWRWVFLLSGAILGLFMAGRAAANFWAMTGELGGYEECFPDFTGCPPLAGRGDPWWVLFLR